MIENNADTLAFRMWLRLHLPCHPIAVGWFNPGCVPSTYILWQPHFTHAAYMGYVDLHLRLLHAGYATLPASATVPNAGTFGTVVQFLHPET